MMHLVMGILLGLAFLAMAQAICWVVGFHPRRGILPSMVVWIVLSAVAVGLGWLDHAADSDARWRTLLVLAGVPVAVAALLACQK